MKVYLDSQIWSYIQRTPEVQLYFEKQKNEQNWQYYISVAHLEEIFNAKQREEGEKIGITASLEKTIQSIAENGVITPCEHGLTFAENSYSETYERVVKNNTLNICADRSLIRQKSDKQCYEAKNLFEGITHTKEDEYKTVWKIERVKSELSRCSENHAKISRELLNPNNALIKDLASVYGKQQAVYVVCKLLKASETEISFGIFEKIKNDYDKLEYVVEQLFFVLTRCGYKRDGTTKHAISGTYDIQHSINSTFCDIFITNDNNFADKFKAIAYYLDIPITILKWNDIQKEIQIARNDLN